VVTLLFCEPVAGEEAVILSQVIVNECNVGYETLRNLLLKSFNGHRVLHLRQLKRLVDEAMARVSTSSEKIPMVFEFSSGNLVVVDGLAALRSQEQVGPITNAIYLLTCLSLFHQQVCREHFIPSICSPDLLSDFES